MKQLTILVAPVSAVGHVNACIGTTLPLLRRGHRVVFFLDEPYRGKLLSKGFEEYIYTLDIQNKAGKNVANPGKQIALDLLENKIFGPMSIEEQMKNFKTFLLKTVYSESVITQSNRHLEKAIEEIKPDCFVVDNTYLLPAIYYSGKPWIHNMSFAPLFYTKHDDAPPGVNGIAQNSDRSNWKKLKENNNFMLYSETINGYYKKLGYEPYDNNIMLPRTQLMTVYAYPEELDYPFTDKEWFNFEVFDRNEKQEVVDLQELVPKEFYHDSLDGQFTGKLIYVSLGSMGSIDIELMKRLVSILSKTKHKYIVSKGPRHAELELPRNMWGDEFLPQTKIVPLVDLVITHGGNNTVTETFAQGKPMVVMPLFFDQHDNAQRLEETHFGKRINPYSFNDEELIDSIDKLIEDKKLHERLKKASHRIQASTRHQQFCNKLEQLLL